MAGGGGAGSAARAGRVLSVQSHVVRGHCGNKVSFPARPQLSPSRPPLAAAPHPKSCHRRCNRGRFWRPGFPESVFSDVCPTAPVAWARGEQSAVLPMQLLGLDVDPVETVQFSNHTGYPTARGGILDGAGFIELIDGLDENGLLDGYSHLLTGYVGRPCLLQKVVQVLQRLKEKNPEIVYVCDPVMGDNGAFYVKPEVADMYRESVVPLATVVTPNQFELEQLTGMQVHSKEDAFKAIDALHALGPRTVIVSSLFLPEKEGTVVVAGSTVEAQEGGGSRQFCVEVPMLEGYYTGTGDLFAALSLAWMHRLPGQAHRATQLVVATIQAVLRRTAAARGSVGRMSLSEKSAAASAAMELRLVQSIDDIREPPELQ